MSKNLIKVSKFLSFVLRHKPESIGLILDNSGWANITDLIDKAKKSEITMDLNRELITKIVQENDKQRFIISDDCQSIRANQGHSITVDLDLIAKKPPEILFHGTATRYLDSITKEGLSSKQRHHVHLSTDSSTALKVGSRHGKPVILKISALVMYEKDYEFYLSENGVWLTKSIPSKYIEVKNME